MTPETGKLGLLEYTTLPEEEGMMEERVSNLLVPDAVNRRERG